MNPSLLETVYFEISHILKPGGMIFISDGNNIANKRCQKKLPDLWDKWENGPDGVKTDRDTVTKCYLTLRKEIISTRYPNLNEKEISYVAQNTSGLFGDTLLRVVDNFLKTGELIRRPYRKGLCPTNPIDSGVVIERGFYPSYVEMALSSYGIKCRYLTPMKFNGLNWRGKLYRICEFMKFWAVCFLKPGYKYTISEGFQIIGVKEY